METKINNLAAQLAEVLLIVKRKTKKASEETEAGTATVIPMTCMIYKKPHC